MSVWRHARAILLLPGTVVVVVPVAILVLGDGPEPGLGFDGAAAALPVVLGVALAGAGLALWTWTVRLFATLGEGTLAPWDPTRHLVVAGPYRHVRNPMITGVLAFLLGEAMVAGARGLFVWCALFFLVNHLFFLLYEEPSLERRFGGEYRAYRRAVPRWVPRRTPWDRGGVT